MAKAALTRAIRRAPQQLLLALLPERLHLRPSMLVYFAGSNRSKMLQSLLTQRAKLTFHAYASAGKGNEDEEAPPELATPRLVHSKKGERAVMPAAAQQQIRPELHSKPSHGSDWQQPM